MLSLEGNKKIGYKGRVISVLFVSFVILLIRSMVKMQFGNVPHPVPILAIFPLIIAWILGKNYDKYVYLSTVDSLTGLYNRRFITERFLKECKKCIHKGSHIAVLMVDVNHFKTINDCFGHEFGDLVLQDISRILQEVFGEKGIISRWGGDEFLIITKFKDEKILFEKIDYFQNLLSQKDWGILNAHLNVSIGKAIFPIESRNFHDLVAKADAEMYKLKVN